jgi:rhodanese-related sulfurtransferase
MTPLRTWLAGAAVVLAVIAAFAGSPLTGARGAIDVAELARMIAHEEDHVTALELAQWIKDRRAVRILDLRPKPQFDSLHIPGAERVAIDSLAGLGLRSGDTVVLYSEAGAHAAQGWVFLRALGLRRVFFLRGGVYEWIDQVLSPTLAVGATDAERLAFARAAPLSRYFGGLPRSGVPRVEQAKTVAQIRRRGC